MITKTGPFKRLGRRLYATLLAMSAVAIAAGCTTTLWVPVTLAPPKGDDVRLRVEPPRDSASAGARFMTLYYPRMEDDSVLVGTPVAVDTAMILGERIPADRAFVQTRQAIDRGTFDKTVLAVGIGTLALGLVGGVAWIVDCSRHPHGFLC